MVVNDLVVGLSLDVMATKQKIYETFSFQFQYLANETIDVLCTKIVGYQCLQAGLERIDVQDSQNPRSYQKYYDTILRSPCRPNVSTGIKIVEPCRK